MCVFSSVRLGSSEVVLVAVETGEDAGVCVCVREGMGGRVVFQVMEILLVLVCVSDK